MKHQLLWPQSLADIGLSDHQRSMCEPLLRHRVCILAGTPGTGKAQPLDAKVLTPNGWKLMGEIEVGDEIVHPKGGISKVTGVFPQGFKEVFRVSFSDGTSTECCNEHLWFTTTVNEDRRKGGGSVKNTGEIKRSLKTKSTKRPNGRNNHCAPMVITTLDFNSNEAKPLDPYLLGLLLGDGTMTVSPIRFCKPDQFIIDEIAKRLPKGCEIIPVGNGKDYRIVRAGEDRRNSAVKSPCLEAIRELGLLGCRSETKFIPKQYLFSSATDRLAVLQGLFDTDGFPDGSCIEYSTCSEHLANDVEFLVRSLGGRCHIELKIPTYTHEGEKKEGQVSYRMNARLPEGLPPFLLPRKAEKSKNATRVINRFFNAIDFSDMKECQCISIDNPDGLYITDDFVVTHNTYSSAKIIKLMASNSAIGLPNIAVASPTGKAATRITEFMQKNGLDLQATTIHRLLGYNPSLPSGFEFNRAQPLPFKAMIVDEASMISVDLMASLLDAIPKGCHVLFVGDPHQLPPVGHGAPLRDMLAAAMIPSATLTEIQRNAGMIVQACSAIKDQRRFLTTEKLNAESGENLKWVVAPTPEEQISTLKTIVEAVRNNKRYDPVWDVQVLCALNERSKVSRVKINEELQSVLNPLREGEMQVCIRPKRDSVSGEYFRLRDKVICLKNGEHALAQLGTEDSFASHKRKITPTDAESYDLVRENGETKKVYIANGDQGEVLALSKKAVIIKFRWPERTVRVPLGKQVEIETGEVSTATPATPGEVQKTTPTAPPAKGEEGGKRKANISDFALCYACTVHKAQGSSWPFVILVVDDAAGMIATREHAYTAISRAEKACLLLGKPATLEKQCAKSEMAKRRTYLRELLDATLI